MADISYTPTTWADGAEGGTPVNSTRLNNIEQGIVDAVAAIGPNDTAQDGSLKEQIDALGDSISSTSGTLQTTAVVSQGSIKYYSFGKVVMVVLYSSLKASAAWTNLATLPSGLRPSESVYAAADAEGNLSTVYIGSSGAIQVSRPNVVYNTSITFIAS